MADFNWNNPYPSIRTPLLARNVVATSQPLAAQAGLRMLLKGGNAVDAAVAAAAALVVVEPVSCGLGGDAFAMIWDGTELHGLNASGPAPAAWTPAYFERKHAGEMPQRGWDSVTVPGMVAGWVELAERFGRLPFSDLFEPAIELAERGYLVSPIVQRKWAAAVPHLKDQPGFKRVFMPHGRAPHIGEQFVFADAAHGLTRIAETHGEVFYRGELAEAMVQHAQQHGGALALDDLAGYRPEWVTPIQKDFAGFTVHELPPNGQGIAALMALGIVDKLEIGRFPCDSADSLHLQIEAMKLAFADTYRWVADSRHMSKVTAHDLLDDAYLSERARLIDRTRAGLFRHGAPRGGTVYLAAADDSGMMVSFIQSNYQGFGSGVVVPETGISLQNRGTGFSLDAKHPNCVAPGKRPFHTIIPGFLSKDGQPQMSFGVMGANMQPQGHLQALVRMLCYGQQPQAACDAPRWKINGGMAVELEAATAPEIAQELARRGHHITTAADDSLDFGSGQFVWKRENGYIAASDARRDGQAVGF
ncbi:gamma-glutamyltransferase family protein [Noviherbaspirillum autotrophicum]|uniref:Gamma-glutamyltransferase n=1 Tax=Noviherbaspirillum autotrophicum TaxID=709839 RepID=A0A0C1YMR6_9BURK|nr:gamma-glutamyltransferase family protein [Noviherbaspirillum autotrophicum]KIF81817.1 gamma-glutamyltransferase [Noviherbaspirillum autotrophicum]